MPPSLWLQQLCLSPLTQQQLPSWPQQPPLLTRQRYKQLQRSTPSILLLLLLLPLCQPSQHLCCLPQQRLLPQWHPLTLQYQWCLSSLK